MQNGPKTVMSRRQHKPAASFDARSMRWTSSATRPDWDCWGDGMGEIDVLRALQCSLIDLP